MHIKGATKRLILLIALTSLAQTAYNNVKKSPPQPQIVPLVGIFYQPGFENFEGIVNPKKNYQYIFRSYEKWVAQTGAMPVLIPYDIDERSLRFIVENLQMVLIPGGNAKLYNETGEPTEYHKVVETVLEIVKEKHEQGIYYPLEGTCQGMQQMAAILGHPKIVKCVYNATDAMLQVTKGRDFLKSQFWGSFDQGLVDHVWRSKNIYFWNRCGISLPDFDKYLAQEAWLTGVARDPSGKLFVASFEHKVYPIFTTQYHPEKNQYEKFGVFDFVVKTGQNLRLMREMIVELVERTKVHAQELDSIHPVVRQYLSTYQIPKRMKERNSQFYVRKRRYPGEE